MGIYLKIDGVDGGATHEQHKNWIDISGIDFNISRYITSVSGAVSNREGVQPAFSDLHLGKRYDKASLKLKQLAASGLASKKALIHFVTTGDPGETYLEITLNNALISNYSLTCGKDYMPEESFSLNYTEVEWKFTEYDENNKAQSPLVSGYNLATCKIK
ncbi:Hcp family type VI secretion system effector [Pseudochrobactrum sp. HB0163]|uniref:Hcp family type VI secretion system effector n=1 Tax=Pseudochrobactrum sp. HB0163 TaxID=3450708 RepID=UPI003F6DF766